MFRHLMQVFVKSFTESGSVLLTFVKAASMPKQSPVFVKICEQTSFLEGFDWRVL